MKKQVISYPNVCLFSDGLGFYQDRRHLMRTMTTSSACLDQHWSICRLGAWPVFLADEGPPVSLESAIWRADEAVSRSDTVLVIF
jgi:hypothetical protein